ncbi:putative toxin-antitoxin system toxin component, PIN family [Bacteroidota bacterium]
MKIVLDTNILVISLSTKSKYHIILEKLINGEFELMISNEILLEYIEVITVKYGKVTADYFSSFLLYSDNVRKITPYYHWNLIESDADDNKFLDCVIAGQADFIVTNDNHFNIMKQIEFPSIKVMDIDGFLNLLLNK